MTTQGERSTAAGLRRLLAVLPVLLGVLVMHGLTSNHDLGMAAAAHPSGHGESMSAAAGGAVAPSTSMAPRQATTATTPPLVAVLDDATRHAGHDMEPVCLGALTTSVLALALARARRRGGPVGRALLAPAVEVPRRAPPSGTAGGPSLTRLCISRT